jgi:hypothetical protein
VALALVLPGAQLPDLAQPLVLALVPAPFPQEPELPVLARLALEPAVPVELLSLLSRPSFSAAMARTTR